MVHTIRKRLLRDDRSSYHATDEIDLAAHARFSYSSEDPDHPVEHLISGRSRWAAANRNTTEQIVIEFDRPERISCLMYDVEEDQLNRTQEVQVELSSDHGRTYHRVLVQEYNFSPNGVTFQHEELRVKPCSVTHVRLVVVPNKGGSGTATVASLRLFG
jgi:F5/8 type C domain-containing protein